MPTDFNAYTHAQLTDMVSTKDPGALIDLTSRFDAAVTKVHEATAFLFSQVGNLDWEGADADAFRTWTIHLVGAGVMMQEYMTGAKTAVDMSADQLQKTVIAPEDPQASQLMSALNSQSAGYAMATDPTGTTNAITQAQATLESDRQAAVQQLTTLAQTYDATTTKIQTLTPPTFSPPPSSMVGELTPINASSPSSSVPSMAPRASYTHDTAAVTHPITQPSFQGSQPDAPPAAPPTSAAVPQQSTLLSTAPPTAGPATAATPSAVPTPASLGSGPGPATGYPGIGPAYVPSQSSVYAPPSPTTPDTASPYDLHGVTPAESPPGESPGISGGRPVEGYGTSGFMPGGGATGPGSASRDSSPAPRRSGISGGEIGAEDPPTEAPPFSPGGTGLVAGQAKDRGITGFMPPSSGENSDRKRRAKSAAYAREDPDSWTTGHIDGVVPPVIE